MKLKLNKHLYLLIIWINYLIGRYLGVTFFKHLSGLRRKLWCHSSEVDEAVEGDVGDCVDDWSTSNTPCTYLLPLPRRQHNIQGVSIDVLHHRRHQQVITNEELWWHGNTLVR